MKTNKIKIILWPALLLLIPLSCTKDRLTNIENEEAIVLIWLEMPPSAPRTYAISEIDENAVATIDVLVFKPSADQTQHPSGWAYDYKALGRDICDKPDNNPISARKQFTVPLIKRTDQQTIVVLANVRKEVIELGDITQTNADKDLLLSRLISNAGSTSPFPIWGEVKASITDATTELKVEGGMLRAIARLDVALEAQVDNFQLEELYIYNSKKSGYIVPFPTHLQDNARRVKAASVPASATEYATWNNATPLFYAVPPTMNRLFERFVYLYEAKAAPADRAGEATCIVVGGVYDTEVNPTYYRIDFYQPDGKTYKDILRNHLYSLHIEKVEGSGYKTPDDAFNSSSVNMKFEVIEWNDGGMSNIFIQGMEYIMLKNNRNTNRDDRTAILFRNIGSTDQVVFDSNIPLEKFAMQLSNGGFFPDPTNNKIIENDRFRIEIKTENGISFFECTALLHFGTQDNPSVLTVTANRIEFTITIIQKDDDPNDWEDGGESGFDFGK
ncbi:MAG: hypothetical protein LBC84_09450 [Prevotellaceae bacterium]|jgi:hypothetical protein|nr:hypothetical protein [Prevotellaceae bacterium]